MVLNFYYWKDRASLFFLPILLSLPLYLQTKNLDTSIKYAGLCLVMTLVILLVFSKSTKVVLFFFQFLLLMSMLYKFIYDTNTIKYILLFLGAVGIAYGLYKLKPKTWIFVLMTILLGIGLILFGVRGDTGVITTIKIGSIQFQAIEVLKFCAVIVLGRFLGETQYIEVKVKEVLLYVAFLIVILLFCKEKGTLLVILASLFITSLLTFYKDESKWILLALVVFIALCGICYGLHKINLLPSALSVQVQLIIDRIVGSDTYQANQALKAIIEGGLWGTRTPMVPVSVCQSDFAIAGFIQLYGLIPFLLLLIATMFLLGYIFLKLTSNRAYEDYALVSAIAFEFIWTSLMNFSYVFVVGINPILSLGLTYTLVLWIGLAYLLFKSSSSTNE